MRKNKQLLVLLLVALGVAGLILFFRGHQKTTRSYNRVASNLQHSWLHNSDVYFYSSSFFAKYNLDNHQITRLSDYLYIKNGITSESWSPGSIVFQASSAGADRDDVTTAASQLGGQPLATHWWRYNFQLKQYQLLTFADQAGCSSLSQLSDELLACVEKRSTDNQTYRLLIINPVDKSTKKLASSEDMISGVSSKGDTVYYLTTALGGGQILHSSSLSAPKDTTIYTGEGELAYNIDSNRIVVNEVISTANDQETRNAATPSKQRLIVLNGQKIILSKNFRALPGQLYLDTDGAVRYASTDGLILSLAHDNVQQVSKPEQNPANSGGSLFTHNKIFFELRSDATLNASSKFSNESGYRSPAGFDPRKDNDTSGNSWVDLASGNVKTAYLYLGNVASSTQEQSVGDNLQSRGFLPSEFNFQWILDGVDFHAPISPKAVVIY